MADCGMVEWRYFFTSQKDIFLNISEWFFLKSSVDYVAWQESFDIEHHGWLWSQGADVEGGELVVGHGEDDGVE